MSYILIKNGTLVDSEREERADLLIKDEKIFGKSVRFTDESLSALGVNSSELKEIDASECFVFPGIIDAHTHYHLVSRGTVTADSFPQGSRLATFGGVTTVIDFADHNKGQNLVQSADYRLSEMKNGGMAIDYSLHQGVYGHGYDSTIPENLERLKEMGIKALKIFTTYRNTGYLLEDEDKLRDLFRNAKRLGMLVTAHCEFNPLIEEINSNWKGNYLPSSHPDMRPAEAEAKAISFYGGIAAEEGCPFYVVHCSSEAGLNEIRKLREAGATVYAETTPTYLYLERSRLEGEDGSLYVMTPPLRTRRDNEALREAVIGGEFNVIATDHCSFTREQKLSSTDVRTIYPGIPGTEELIHLLLSDLRKSLSVSEIIKMVTSGPAKLFGIYPEKGSLNEGSDADVCIYDPRVNWTLCDENVHSAALYTPYRGFKAEGKVCCTLLRGKIVMRDGEYFGVPGEGRFIKQV